MPNLMLMSSPFCVVTCYLPRARVNWHTEHSLAKGRQRQILSSRLGCLEQPKQNQGSIVFARFSSSARRFSVMVVSLPSEGKSKHEIKGMDRRRGSGGARTSYDARRHGSE